MHGVSKPSESVLIQFSSVILGLDSLRGCAIGVEDKATGSENKERDLPSPGLESPPLELRNFSPQRLERRRVFSEGNLCGVLIGFHACHPTG